MHTERRSPCVLKWTVTCRRPVIVDVIPLEGFVRMGDPNPCSPPSNSRLGDIENRPQSVRRWVVICAMIGAVIPVVWGIWVLCSDAIHQGSLPEIERIRCGNGALGVMFLMVIGAPLASGIGALTGFLLSKLAKLT